MGIEPFVAQSEGEWRSMRSGHALAFQHFEEVVSKVIIKRLRTDDKRVLSLLKKHHLEKETVSSPFEVNWDAESDWQEDSQHSSGSCILIPIPSSLTEGLIVRSIGYGEQIESLSKYRFLSDETFTLYTQYSQTIAEERIWFISENVRCRSSVIKSLSSAIMQTSFASEVRLLS